MTDASTVVDDIRKEIRLHGKITFARYMDLALYAPGKGYYSGSPSGFSGSDYVTSPLAHPTFGALLARQIYQIWGIMGRPSRFLIVELGAGNGTLACDILGYLERAAPLFYKSLIYVAVDCTPSPFDSGDSHPNLEYLRSYGLPLRGGTGCVISNEVIDAYPVHRFKVEDGRLTESYVQINAEGKFIENFDEPSTDLILKRLHDLKIPLRDGLNGEINLYIDDWASTVSSCLDSGVVITIDYGDLAEPLYRRPWGTLQTYYLHTNDGSPFMMVGRQDITAHADFTSLINRGALHDLKYEGLIDQGQFLRNLGWEKFFTDVSQKGLGHRELLSNQIGMRHLVEPMYLGDLKVLVQSRNLEIGDQLWGLSSDESREGVGEAEISEIPTMSNQHVSYPGTGYSEQQDDWSYAQFL